MPTVLPRLREGPVLLRAFERRDVDLVRSVADDPLVPLITTVPVSGSSEDALAYIDRQHRRLGTGAGYSFAIADAQSDRAVGYWVASPFRRRGYGRAALHALTTWALTLEEVQRLELYVEPWNEGSWRAAESCGFSREGLLRSWQQVGDARKDMYMYSILPAASSSVVP